MIEFVVGDRTEQSVDAIVLDSIRFVFVQNELRAVFERAAAV